jgi:ABC-2 type transport system permease protein
MNPNVRSLDIMSLAEYKNGAIASYLTLGQSLLQIWPHLVVMITEVVVGFALAYISFMRKEIRA